MAIGQAAGTAAALAVLHNCDTAEVPILELQQRLIEGKAELGCLEGAVTHG
jgi:hypothetical protein